MKATTHSPAWRRTPPFELDDSGRDGLTAKGFRAAAKRSARKSSRTPLELDDGVHDGQAEDAGRQCAVLPFLQQGVEHAAVARQRRVSQRHHMRLHLHL